MQRVFAVRDVKADAFETLIVLPTRGLALRGFVNAAAQPDSPLNKYPADFMLYELGEYDPNTGSINGHSTPIFISSATEALASAQRESQPVPQEATK